MIWLPHKTVATVVEKEGRFLMVEERDAGNVVYNQPAGHLEPGETLIEAAQRETQEETGWQVEITYFLGLYHYTSPVNEISYIRSCFIATPLKKLAGIALDPNIEQTHWFTLEQIRELEGHLRSPLVLPAFEHYIQGIKYPLSLITSL